LAFVALSISLDCNDLEAQTGFWAAALGFEIADRAELHVALGPPDGSGPKLFLNLVPEVKTVKNRMHLDWDVDDMEDEATRLEGLGARRLHRGELPGWCEWITMQDPEGNEFCVEQITADE
jgi:predicted enzyme related to lactoylglutathione lyase